MAGLFVRQPFCSRYNPGMYRFLLTASSTKPHTFRFDEAEVDFQLNDDTTLKLVARNAETLAKATTFHFEGAGFESDDIARQVGERLRLRLRVLNALFNLG